MWQWLLKKKEDINSSPKLQVFTNQKFKNPRKDLYIFVHKLES